ncbi:MAG: PstA family ABC transporter permease, partial [Candidatus Thiodiazotropha sp.]
MNNNLQQQHDRTMVRVQQGLVRRYRQEKRFQRIGLGAIVLGLVFVSFLFISIIANGYTAFQQTYVKLDINFDPELISPVGETDPEVLSKANYGGLVKKTMRGVFPDVSSRREKKVLYGLVSTGASYQLRDMVMQDPALIGTRQSVWVPADDDVDMLIKGHIDLNVPESDRRIKNNQMVWIQSMQAEDRIEKRFNTTFFTAGDSREPELSGIKGAVHGSFFTLMICLLISFPVGVAAAVYLEEFAPKNRWTDIIEVNINNLAAVPSIVFGLLGLAVFINFFGLPRSVPLVGGLVLALMTLPTIIIASRAALKSVPPSIREAALGVGASPMQTITHHVLPLAMPGMLTGTIIGMAQALGETAPLLMIGMVAFIVDIPGGPF